CLRIAPELREKRPHVLCGRLVVPVPVRIERDESKREVSSFRARLFAACWQPECRGGRRSPSTVHHTNTRVRTHRGSLSERAALLPVAQRPRVPLGRSSAARSPRAY